MPAYDYRCESCDSVFEVVRPASERANITCPTCASATKRLFSPVGVVFKGSGFHSTDYRVPSDDKEKAPAPKDSPCGSPESCGSCPAKDA